jgi:hypothetical protein
LNEKQKLKSHIFKKFWATMGCTKRHKDLSEGAREDMGDMERYLDITEGVRNIMGNKERDWPKTGFLGKFWEGQTGSRALPRGPVPSLGAQWGTRTSRTESSRAKVGYPVGYMDITEGSRAMQGNPVRYIDVTESSRAKSGCLLGYFDITEGSKAMLGNIVITKGSRAKIECPVGYIDILKGHKIPR